jgi:kinesin family protein 3/17
MDKVANVAVAASKLKKAANNECVKVVVRCRPMNKKEKAADCKRIVEMDPTLGTVSVTKADADESEPPKIFTLDAVYDWTSQQRTVYDEIGYPIIESVMEGYNGTVFAYGQTGTGKSHTMQGDAEPPEMRGIIPNSFDHVFDAIQNDQTKEFLVRASYLEIYNEEIRDLLGKDSKSKLELKENPEKGVFVKDLNTFVVRNVKEIDHVMNVGQKNRTVGSTLMNQDSSRSHSIFTITIETSEPDPADPKKNKIKAGKLNLVDLAGSERQGKTGATVSYCLRALG